LGGGSQCSCGWPPPCPRPQVLLYTERAQFYNRHRIRGAREILFYQLPEHPQFYAELLNLMEEGAAGETPTGELRAGWGAMQC
jgi:hypothetical protein